MVVRRIHTNVALNRQNGDVLRNSANANGTNSRQITYPDIRIKIVKEIFKLSAGAVRLSTTLIVIIKIYTDSGTREIIEYIICL